MRKKEGRPVKEIATELGLSAKTVENHITEAMNRIRKSLEGEQLAGILFFSLFVSY
jgi:RNA polymerase sigma-70 factor (ECF subfamily)